MNPQENVPPAAPIAPAPQPQAALIGPVELLKFSWHIFTKNWKILAPIAVFPYIISGISTLLTPSLKSYPVLIIIVFVLSIASVVFSIAMSSGFINAIHRLNTEVAPIISFKEQYRIGFSYFWSIVLLGIIGGLAGMGSYVLFLIPGIIFVVYTVFYAYSLVLDGKKGLSAFTESYSIVHGRWPAAFGRLLFLGLMIFVCWLILIGLNLLLSKAFGVAIIPASDSKDGWAGISLGGSIISVVINLIAAGVIAPLAIGYTYRMYISFKETREANVSVAAFKKWIIAFMIIGPIMFIMIMVLGVASIFLASMHRASQMDPARQAEMMKQIQSLETSAASSTPDSSIDQ